MHQHAASPARAEEVHDQVEYLRVQDRRSFKVLACRRRSGQDEYAGADNRADPQRRQPPRAEALF